MGWKHFQYYANSICFFPRVDTYTNDIKSHGSWNCWHLHKHSQKFVLAITYPLSPHMFGAKTNSNKVTALHELPTHQTLTLKSCFHIQDGETPSSSTAFLPLTTVPGLPPIKALTWLSCQLNSPLFQWPTTVLEKQPKKQHVIPTWMIFQKWKVICSFQGNDWWYLSPMVKYRTLKCKLELWGVSISCQELDNS